MFEIVTVNSFSMTSTITIEDTDEEVINLDTSQESIIDVHNNTQNDQIIDDTKHTFSMADDSDVIIEHVGNNEEDSKAEVLDDAIIPKPLFKVIFRDERVSRQYRKQVKEFLMQLISLENSNEEQGDNNDSYDLTLDIWDSDVDCISQSIETITESKDTIHNSLFTVDTQPTIKDELDVPTYGKKYENAFEIPNSEMITKLNDECTSKLMCFKPRNQANINKNRRNFSKKGNSRSVRYHLEDDQKFGHMIPGQLSNNLRKALGLKYNELPTHIYRMRILGYPPGWLEEARLQHSGLSLFNSDGVAEDDPNSEPGEIIHSEEMDQYDIKKIYDFPGFNVPPPPGTQDDSSQYRAPQMQAFQSKQTMLLILKGKKADEGYKRKKLKISTTLLKDGTETIPIEMDLADVEEGIVERVPVNGLFVPPLPMDSSVKPPEPPPLPLLPPPPPPPLVNSISEDSDCQFQESPSLESVDNNASPSSRANSPSLSELECIKKQLLVELQDSNSQSNLDTLGKNNFVNSTPKLDMPPPSNDNTPEINRSRDSRITLNTSHGSIKSIDLGTPILQSTSPYSKLPSSDKFSKDICDVINFENLPDSTGKYEQMSGVLQKVRNTLAKLYQE